MNDTAPPHVEYLKKIIADHDARDMALHILDLGAPFPRYALPTPATGPELAAVMMAEAHLKAADLGVHLGERLVDTLFCAREPEARALRLAHPGEHPGDRRAVEIAEAMIQVGRAAAARLGDASDADAVLHKLEMSPCPCCGRPFGAEG